MASERGNRRKTHEESSWFPIVRVVARHPALWATAARQARRSVPRRWWRRPPFLPIPDAAYVEFRMETAFGSGGRPEAADVVRWLTWCRDTDKQRAGH